MNDDEDDEALAAKRDAKAEDLAPTIGMTPLSKVTGSLIDQLRPKASAVKPTAHHLPPLPAWTKRQFFCVHGRHGDKMAIWVDDECLESHTWYERPDGTGTYRGARLWHSYRDEFGRAFALRCPRSLTPEEHGRIQIDSPPGHWRSVLQGYTRDKSETGSMPDPEERFE